MQLIIKQLLGFIREIIRGKAKVFANIGSFATAAKSIQREYSHFGTGAKAVPAAAYTYLNCKDRCGSRDNLIPVSLILS